MQRFINRYYIKLRKNYEVYSQGVSMFLHKNFSALSKEVKNFYSLLIDLPNEDYTLPSDLSQYISKPKKFVILAILASIGFFILWGGLAPLDSAAVAQGYITLSNKKKTIQHQDGGTIDDIFIEDGSRVESGQKLIKLHDSQAKAKLQIIFSELRKERATLIRLYGERDLAQDISFEDKIFDQSLIEVRELIKVQKALFEDKKNIITNQQDIMKQRVMQYNESINGMKAQQLSLKKQLEIVKEELYNVEQLYKRGLALQDRLHFIRRAEQDIQGKLGEISSHIASTLESISEVELQMLKLQVENSKEINALINETQTKITDLQEQYNLASDILERTTIRSPIDGIVTGLFYHTIGGVITPGTKIMDIVPQDEPLLVEAHVLPKDIVHMQPGSIAKIQLSAYKSRLVPRIKGEVIYVSADRSQDNNQAGHYYYVIRIKLDEEELKRINYDIKLAPGMPADVFIVKGERTFLQYILGPLLDSFHKAFKEH